MVFVFLTPVIILIVVITVLLFNIMKKSPEYKETTELSPSRAIKKRAVNLHLLGNDAPKHNNKKRNMVYTSFIRKSPCMANKINLMSERETRYNG